MTCIVRTRPEGSCSSPAVDLTDDAGRLWCLSLLNTSSTTTCMISELNYSPAATLLRMYAHQSSHTARPADINGPVAHHNIMMMLEVVPASPVPEHSRSLVCEWLVSLMAPLHASGMCPKTLKLLKGMSACFQSVLSGSNDQVNDQ